MSSLKELTAKRSAIKGNLTRFKTFFVNIDSANPDLVQLELRLGKLQSSWDSFCEIQIAIELIDEENFEAHERERESFENDYFNFVALARRLIDRGTTPSVSSNLARETNRSADNRTHNIKLPTINLPNFDGCYSGWLYFKDTFRSIIHENDEISEVQKFHYLRLSLKGEAADVIRALEVSAANYTTAWELLVERYENKTLLVNNHVRALLNLPIITKESCVALRQLLDGLTKHIRALKVLEQPVESWDTLIIHIMSNKLDSITRRDWESKNNNREKLPSINDLTAFLREKCTLLETLSPEISEKKVKSRSLVSNENSSENLNCLVCKGNHLLFQCSNFLKLSPGKRYSVVKSHNLCTNCLKGDHKNSDCRSTNCKKCQKRHHTFLHFENVPGESNISTERNNTSTQGEPETHAVVGHSRINSNQTLLSTALIKVQDKFGNYHTCRALLDSGSQSNFITSNLADKLQTDKQKINMAVSGLNQALNQINHSTNINIMSRNTSFESTINCLIIPRVTDKLPAVSFNKNNLNIPKNIKLADPKFNESNSIDILIGAGIFWSLLRVGQITLGNEKPLLQKTALGWIISGEIPQKLVNYFNTQCHFVSNTDIDHYLTKFWDIEEYEKMPLSPEDAAIESFFKATTQRDVDGKFIVRLPLKMPAKNLGESKNTAIKRLYSIENKLKTKPDLREQYVQFMDEYINLNHMTKLSNINDSETYYIPHHYVKKETSITTKLRVVFDASAKTNSGYSLNDLQMVGPTIQHDLFSIVSRYRSHKYVLAGDITKMYRQIQIHPDDRKLQRIVWRSDSSKPIEYFELNTVTYGTAAAPFLAIRCLHELAHQYKNIYPIASKIILADFYVDDLLTGADNTESLQKMYHEISLILNSGGFVLNKWATNNNELLETISISQPNVILNIGNENESHALGLLWHSQSDTLSYTIKDSDIDQPISKRKILSVIAQIYDPLGLLGPAIVLAKILLQKLWQLKIPWDAEVPSDIQHEWQTFYSQLNDLRNIHIPRRVVCDNPVTIEVHGFADSSQFAYGACIYIRSSDNVGNCQVNLLCAKSRIAPLKCVTIPRLELCAALLLARLFHKIKLSLNLSFSNVHLWSDSTIVLAWIRATPNMWKVFIANRVAEIQTLTEINMWRHVRSQTNPADIISRGAYPQVLRDSKLWWDGPDWLGQPPTSWPIDISNDCNFDSVPPECDFELRTKPTITLIGVDTLNLFEKYSNFSKLQRVVAYILRFKHNASASQTVKQFGPLTRNELDSSLNTLVKLVQGQTFVTEIADLTHNKSVNSKSRLLQLNPFVDDTGILRVGGRLSKSNFDFNKKHPAVLPTKHPFVKMLVTYEHIRLLHAGPQHVLASLRERFWILSARNLVRKTLHGCVICFRISPKETKYLMADLPNIRLTPTRPFVNCGIDYCGPFKLRDRKTRKFNITKAYVCLFVCLSTKAIHLELTSDLNSDSFLACLHRFVARRGKCENIYSDNGTNFIGANAELQRFLKSVEGELLTEMGQKGISWHFIPPRSPHFGGIWEAGVKSTKYHLKRVIGEAMLTYEEFNTVLIQIEACLNSRPLYPLSSDPNDPNPLTPAHFMIGQPFTSIPTPNLSNAKEASLSRFKRCQKMTQDFWTRWSKEYISEMQIRRKWKSTASNQLKPDALVVIKDDHLPPCKWSLGRILHLHPGLDGIVRVVTVKTLSGVYKRPVTKICVLPSDSDE